MKRSTSHILTTHTGSLPRLRELQELLRLREEHRPLDQAAFAEGVRTAVADVVQQQIAIGLDVINDGEQERSQYCLLYTSPSPRDRQKSRMPSSA